MSPLELVDRAHRLDATLSNDGLLDENAPRWLGTVSNRSPDERQRLALAFARRQGAIGNRRYRTVAGCDAETATRKCVGLVATGLVEKRGDRWGTVWGFLRDPTPPVPGDTSDPFAPSPPEPRRHLDRHGLAVAALRQDCRRRAAQRAAAARPDEDEGTVERTEASEISCRNR